MLLLKDGSRGQCTQSLCQAESLVKIMRDGELESSNAVAKLQEGFTDRIRNKRVNSSTMLSTPTIIMTPPQEPEPEPEQEPSLPPEEKVAPSSTPRTFQLPVSSTELRPSGPGSRSPGRRKCSFPAALCDLGGLGLSASSGMSTRRRLSNVGGAVTRKLSVTIGWRTPTPPTQEIINQGRKLITQYIWQRLRSCGIQARRCGIRRVGTVASPGNDLVQVCHELERRYPKVYSAVARQAGATAGGLLVSEDAAVDLLTQVGRELLLSRAEGGPGVSWGRIAAVFAVAGGLAVDCARQGHPEYVPALIGAVVDLLEEDVAIWVAAKGGWNGISQHCSAPSRQCSLLNELIDWMNSNLATSGGFGIAVASFLIAAVSIVLAVRYFSRLAFLY